MVLFETLKRKEEFFQLMQEPIHIAEERKEVSTAIKTLQAAEKIIKKDPDLSSYSRYEGDAKKAPAPKSKQ
jgi:hypothetical protein